MISRRQLLQGIAATSILSLSRPLWASKPASHFLKPGEKLKPGEYVWEPELSPEGPVAILVSLMITDLAAGPETRSDRDFVIVNSEFVQS